MAFIRKLLKTIFAANGCKEGFTLMEDGYCYYASDVYASFENANIDCRSRGAELVSMHSYWENVIAMKFMLYAHEVLHRPASQVIWIGLQCSNGSLSSCAWTDGSRFDYSSWWVDRFDEGYYWGVMYQEATLRGRWITWLDTIGLPFICKHRGAVGVFEPSDSQLPQCNIGFWPIDGNNSCYGFDSIVRNSWSSCDSRCIQSGGRCASMRKREENTELYALFQRTQPPSDLTNGYHIGLKENAGTWQWVDGTLYGDTFWKESYPRPGETPYVSTTTNGLWATGAPQEFRAQACIQKPIYQRSNDDCPEDQHFGMGEIRSPGYPESYSAHLTCMYTLYDRIVADLNPNSIWGDAIRTKLAIYFTAFNIHPADVVEIFDGADTSAPLIAAIRGIAGARKEYYSNGYNMTIRFTSNGGNGYKGWRALFGPYTTKP